MSAPLQCLECLMFHPQYCSGAITDKNIVCPEHCSSVPHRCELSAQCPEAFEDEPCFYSLSRYGAKPPTYCIYASEINGRPTYVSDKPFLH